MKNMMSIRLILLAVSLSVVSSGMVSAQKLAFPGAEGFGAYSQGGRGGDVYYVTNLNDSGGGSLREGILSANGPRTIVFAVSGVIQLQSNLVVNNDYITIAGQTAPGDGICLRDACFKVSADHVIVRFIRSRLGDEAGRQSDAISITNGANIIVDHCTASWSVDETLSCQSGTVDLLTVQWCMVAESLRDSIHDKGEHGYGGIIGSLRQSYHHNLFAHHSSRNPKVTWRRHCKVDFRNNVIYNWGYNTCYDGSNAHMNWTNNYYKYGPATKTSVRNRIFKLDDKDNVADANSYKAQLYAEDNYIWGHPGVTADNWAGGIDFGTGTSQAKNRVYEPFNYPAITEQSAHEAYDLVLAGAGASLVRDAIDTRIVSEVGTQTATYGDGIIDSQNDVGAWPAYNTYNVPTDTDLDGMADDWEICKNLDISNAQDRNDYDLNPNYTNLEVYLNDLADGYEVHPIEPTDMPDFGKLSRYWQNNCNESNNWCEGLDYNCSNAMDIIDLRQFALRWLNW